ncbi:MAG: COG4705 family protein [Trebonia sp.]
MPLLNRETLVKVPEITLLFWIAKLCTTCFGESFSDYVFFNDYIGRTAAILMGLALILVCYGIQLAMKKYIPLIYWLAVTAVAIFGTMSADFLNKNLGMALWESTVLLLALQAAVFYAWWKTEGTLSVHSIASTRREVFYWLTVYLTFSLGTAAGDYVAGPLALGTLDSTLLFLGAMIVPLVGWKWLRFSPVFSFWLAYTITRPLGASFGDYLAVPAPYGDGLQIGTGPISLYSGIVLLAVIAALAVTYYRRKTAPAGEVTVAVS